VGAAAADTTALSKLIRSLSAAEQRFTWLAMTDSLASNATQHHRRLHADGRCATCGVQEDNEHMLTCGQEGAALKAAMRATLLDRLAAAIADRQVAHNLNRGRDAFVAERPLPVQIVQQLPDDVRGALDAVERAPVLGLLIGALPPALTRLLGATWAGRTARELNDRAFRMYCMCMADPRRRFRRLPVDDEDVLVDPSGG